MHDDRLNAGGTSSVRARLSALLAALILATAGVAWAGCGNDDNGSSAAAEGESIGQSEATSGESIGESEATSGEEAGESAAKSGEETGESAAKEGEDIGKSYEDKYK